MQFELILVLFGFLTILLFWFIHLIANYLQVAIKFKQLKSNLIYAAILVVDNHYLLSVNDPVKFKGFLELKQKVWEKRSDPISVFWEPTAKLLLDFTDFQNLNSKNSNTRLENVSNLLRESMHEYNKEVILIQHKLEKPLFRLLNRYILKIDIAQNPLLTLETSTIGL